MIPETLASALLPVLLSAGVGLLGFIGVGIFKRVTTLERKMEARHLEVSVRLMHIETLLGEANGRQYYRGKEGC